MYKLLLTEKEEKIISWLIDTKNDRTLEIHCDEDPDRDDSCSDDHRLRRGDILIAAVERIDPGLNCAFLRAGSGKLTRHLYLDLKNTGATVFTKKSKSSDLKAGDELVVCVLRESIKGKLPAVTCELSLTGRYVIVMHSGSQISVSRRVDGALRNDLSETGRIILQETETVLPGAGVLLRTAAASATREQCIAEAKALAQQLGSILKTAPFRPAGTVLHRADPSWLKRVLETDPEKTEEILTDSEYCFKKLSESLTDRIRFYDDRMISLKNLYSLDTRLANALSKTVYLKSGGTLIIEPTQAMTVIDVNSGKNRSAKRIAGHDTYFLKLNMEAACEAARQIRLRNISGIIIIDFINMHSQESRDALGEELRKQLLGDPVRCVFAGFTSLGLAQITREKREPPLREML